VGKIGVLTKGLATNLASDFAHAEIGTRGHNASRRACTYRLICT
jgi:hypothetical protein